MPADRSLSRPRAFPRSRPSRPERARALVGLGLLALLGALAGCGGSSKHAATTPTLTRSAAARTTPLPLARPGVEWPTYGFDDARTRDTPSLALAPPFRLTWTFHGRALLEFPPVVAYGDVFLPNINGHLFAIDAQTGKTVWRYSSGMCGWSSPAVGGGTVYQTFVADSECGSHAQGGEIVALQATSGKVRWLRHIAACESSALLADGRVYVGTWAGTILALDAATGATIWSYDAGAAVKGSLSLWDGRVYVGTYGGEVLALDASNGGLAWQESGYGELYSSPALADGRLVIGSLDGDVDALDAADGHLLWQDRTGGYVYASPALADGLVLIGSYDQHFYALDAANGNMRWVFSAQGAISGSASVIGGIVYFSTFDHRTYALRVENGEPVARFDDGEYSPVVAAPGHLYLTGLGRLYAYVMRR